MVHRPKPNPNAATIVSRRVASLTRGSRAGGQANKANTRQCYRKHVQPKSTRWGPLTNCEREWDGNELIEIESSATAPKTTFNAAQIGQRGIHRTYM